MSISSSSQYWAAGPGAAPWGAFRHLLAHGGIRAVQQRSPPQTPEEAQSQHPGEWGSSVENWGGRGPHNDSRIWFENAFLTAAFWVTLWSLKGLCACVLSNLIIGKIIFCNSWLFSVKNTHWPSEIAITAVTEPQGFECFKELICIKCHPITSEGKRLYSCCLRLGARCDTFKVLHSFVHKKSEQ